MLIDSHDWKLLKEKPGRQLYVCKKCGGCKIIEGEGDKAVYISDVRRDCDLYVMERALG